MAQAFDRIDIHAFIEFPHDLLRVAPHTATSQVFSQKRWEWKGGIQIHDRPKTLRREVRALLFPLLFDGLALVYCRPACGIIECGESVRRFNRHSLGPLSHRRARHAYAVGLPTCRRRSE